MSKLNIIQTVDTISNKYLKVSGKDPTFRGVPWKNAPDIATTSRRPHVRMWHRHLHGGAGVAADGEGLWAEGLVAVQALGWRRMGSSWENVGKIMVYKCICHGIWEKNISNIWISMQNMSEIVYECECRHLQGLIGIRMPSISINRYGPNRWIIVSLEASKKAACELMPKYLSCGTRHHEEWALSTLKISFINITFC